MTSNWDTSRERLSRGEHKIKPNRELAELVDRSIFPKPTPRGGSRDKGELSGSSTIIESPAKQVAEKEKFSPNHIRKRSRNSSSTTLFVSGRSPDIRVPYPCYEGKLHYVEKSKASTRHTITPTGISRILDNTMHFPLSREEDLLCSSEVGKAVRINNSAKCTASLFIEARRLRAVSRLCRHFENVVSKHLGKCWANAFEEFLLCHDGTEDPIIPKDERVVSFLRSRLTAKHISSVAVEKVVGTLIPLVGRAREYIKQEMISVRKNGIVDTKVAIQRHGNRVRLSFNGTKVELNAEHYEKLHHLFSMENSKAQSGCHDKPSETDFESAAFALVCRYTSVQGGMFHTVAGHHAALHGAVFDVLRDGMGVDVECFASPLNCRWHRFCSPFTDTDAPFGSLGSFFNFKPQEGSYQCNPPFDEDLVRRTVEHITALIKAADRSSRALSFVIITPHWPGRTSWENLAGSPHVAHVQIVPLREHGFLEGAQHTKQTQYRIASCNTSVVFLQSRSGRKRYPITRTFLSALMFAFRPHRELDPS